MTTTTNSPTTNGTPPRSRRRWSRRKINRELLNLLTVLILLIFALPAIWIIFTAFRPANEVNVTPPVWIPKRLTLDAFANLFGLNPEYASGVPVMAYLRNSSLTALIATTIALTVGTMTGYAFSRFEFKYHTFVFLMIMLSRRAGRRPGSTALSVDAQVRPGQHLGRPGVCLCGRQHSLYLLADGRFLSPDTKGIGRIGLYRRLRLLDRILAY